MTSRTNIRSRLTFQKEGKERPGWRTSSSNRGEEEAQTFHRSASAYRAEPRSERSPNSASTFYMFVYILTFIVKYVKCTSERKTLSAMNVIRFQRHLIFTRSLQLVFNSNFTSLFSDLRRLQTSKMTFGKKRLPNSNLILLARIGGGRST